MADYLFSIFLIFILIAIFTVQLTMCFKAKSRAVRFMPVSLCLILSNAWLLSPILPNDNVRLGFALLSLYTLIAAILCGITLAVYEIVHLIKKFKNKKSVNNETDEAPAPSDAQRDKRKKEFAKLQISYIILVFFALAVIGPNTDLLIVDMFGLPYTFFSIVINSIALVFIVKCIVMLIRSKQYLVIGVTGVLIVSSILFLFGGSELYIASAGKNDTVEVTDSNRAHIESLIPAEYTEEIPNIAKATKIEHIIEFFENDNYEIYYEDGTTYTIWPSKGIPSLEDYIHADGYEAYLARPEYARDASHVAVTSAVTLISSVTLAVLCIKRRKNEPAEEAKEPTAT